MLVIRRAIRQAARAFRPFPIDVGARAPLLPHASILSAELHPLVEAAWGVRLSSTANRTPNGPAAAVSVSAAPKRRASPKPAATAAAHSPGSPKPSVPTEYIFGVQRKGKSAKGFVPLAARDDMVIGFLAEEIIKKLKLDVPLDSITLRLVGKGTDGKDTSVELGSMDTVHDALENAKKILKLDMAKLRVVVDVTETPTTTAASAAILSATADMKDVMAEVQPLARQAVDAAAALRADVSKLTVLKQLRVGMTAAEARAAGVTVLREDAAGVMTVGTFKIPRLNSNVVDVPKTFDAMSDDAGTTFLLLPQRIERAMELVDAVTAGRKHATHLSGPNGVGKSAVLLLAYLILVARDIPVVFIARTNEWVEALKEDPACGNAFFLETLWRQNADLIVKSPTLRTVFVDVIMDKEQPFRLGLMKKLRDAVTTVLHVGKDASNVRGIAVLLDEVQNITTAALHAVQVPSPRDALAGAGQYFADTWFTWNNKNYVFQRLSAASAHSWRDSNLPSGEKDRLRIMAPLADEDREALQNAASSPAYVRDGTVLRDVVAATGNMLRSLVSAAKLLPATGAITKSHLSSMWDELWGPMVAECQVWMNSLPSDARRRAAANSVMPLLKGEQRWGDALVLYDAGIVYRTADATSSVVRPVSGMANAVILHVTSAFQREHRSHLSEFKEPSVKGYEFERQVLVSFDPFQGLLQCKRLDGSDADALLVHSSYSLPFHKLEEVVLRDRGVLYRPFDPNYACDGIIMSVDDSGQLRIFIVECSVTDPCTADRPAKVAKLFLSDGVVRKLQAAYPHAVITILLCYPEALKPRKSLPEAAAALCKHDPLPMSTDGLQPAAAASSAATTAAPAATALPAAAGSVRIRVLDLHVLRTALGVLA